MERAVLPTKIFDTREKFAGYGFNKSHAAAYATDRVSNRLSLKRGAAIYPVEFLAASISLDLWQYRQLALSSMEARRLKFRSWRGREHVDGRFYVAGRRGRLRLGALKAWAWKRCGTRGVRAAMASFSSLL